MIEKNTLLESNIVKNLSKFIICIGLTLLLVGCSNSDSSKTYNIEKKDTQLNVSNDEIMTTINDIAKEKRVLGTDGEKKAANYLKDKLENYGYSVRYQDFEVFKADYSKIKEYMYNEDVNIFLDINPTNSKESKGIARNVIAKSKNFDDSKKSLYLVSHYDTTKDTTGVYDNATGVSAVVELARVLQNYNSKDFNIVFILFSAEEYNKNGSRYYLSQLSKSERDNILGCINIDMIGYTGFRYEDWPQVEEVEVMLAPWIKKDALETLLNDQFNNKYSVNNEMGGMSDDISFVRLGVPTLYLADKNFPTGFNIEEKNFESQLEPVKVDSISDLCKDIYTFIKNFDINKFNELNSISDEEKGVFRNS